MPAVCSKLSQGCLKTTQGSSSAGHEKKVEKFGVTKTAIRLARDFLSPQDSRQLGVGLLALVVSSGANLSFPTLMGRTLDTALTYQRVPRRPRCLFISVCALLGFGALASWLRVYSFTTITHRVQQAIRKRLLCTLLLQPSDSGDDAEKTGHIGVRLGEDVEAATQMITTNVASVLRGLSSTLGGTILLFSICPQLTLVTLALVPVIGTGAIAYRSRQKLFYRQLQDDLTEVLEYAEERLSNLETVKQFAKEEYEALEIQRMLDSSRAIAKRVGTADGIMMAGLFLSVNVALITVVYLGGYWVRKGRITVGNLASFSIYSSMVGLGCSSLSSAYGSMVKASVSADRIFAIMDKSVKQARLSGLQLPEVRGEIEFRDVCFRYLSRPQVPVLEHVSLTVHAGHTIALTGKSGSGKTTLTRLATRLLSPTSGAIFIDSHSLDTLDSHWIRDRVFGVVSQEPVLFNTTILQNIAYGRPDASFAEIEKAAQEANADEFIMQFPDHYYTKVGMRGALLSSGQKQRIAIARALIKNPPCLILDEATSALDPESEEAVHTALRRLMKGRTVIMVTHGSSSLGNVHEVHKKLESH